VLGAQAMMKQEPMWIEKRRVQQVLTGTGGISWMTIQALRRRRAKEREAKEADENEERARRLATRAKAATHAGS